MKLVVTGSRDADEAEAAQLLSNYIFGGEHLLIDVLVGCCPRGVDKAVRDVMAEPRVFLADWDANGKAAGPIRNREMIKAAGHDAVLLAMPSRGSTNRGTMDCIKQALAAGIDVDVRWVNRAGGNK